MPSEVSFPRLPLIAGGSLVAFALAAALLGRVVGLSQAEAPGKPTAERTLRFADRADGAVVITLADTGQVVDVATGQSGFLRGTLRGFARTRRADKVGSFPPLRLTGYADGRLILFDPQTGRQVEIEAFGSANEAVFVRLLTQTPRAPAAAAAEKSS